MTYVCAHASKCARSRQKVMCTGGKVRANLGDTTCGLIRVADLGDRILKWAKTDEKI